MTILGCIFFLVVCYSSFRTSYVYGLEFKKFMKPCFVGEEIENTCSDPSESCHEKLGTELKLVRLNGIKVILIHKGEQGNVIKMLSFIG